MVSHDSAPASRRASRVGTFRANHSRPRVPQDRSYLVRIRAVKALWLLAFLALIFVPLALAPGAGGEHRPWSSGGIAIELCLSTGLLGLSTLAATMVLPSRVRSLTEAFGIEAVLRSHRWLALATTALVIAHVVFLEIDRPASLLLLYPVTGPPRARAGLSATVSMVLLCWLTLKRRKLNTRYEIWRWVHVMLAVVALVGTYIHMIFLNHLMQNAAERTTFWAILVSVSAILINRWIRRPVASLRNAYLVKAVYPETPTVSTLVLSPARPGQRPMRYRPGQFAWLRLDSPFGPLQGNPFTIASGVDSPRDIEFTIRNAGDFTGSIRSLTPGRRVYLDGPYGSFNDDARPGASLLLIAGGVGVSPMMSILRSHAYRGDRRHHCLVVAARTPDELIYRDELRELAAELRLEVIEVVSAPPPGWTGITGRVDHDLLTVVLDGPELVDPSVFICGPSRMMTDVRRALRELGVRPERVRTEEFDLV